MIDFLETETLWLFHQVPSYAASPDHGEPCVSETAPRAMGMLEISMIFTAVAVVVFLVTGLNQPVYSLSLDDH